MQTLEVQKAFQINMNVKKEVVILCPSQFWCSTSCQSISSLLKMDDEHYTKVCN